MSERVRYPIRQFASVADFDASVSPTPNLRYARRFSMDVAEDALRDMAPAVAEFVARKLGDRIEYEQRDSVQRVVDSYLSDRAWAEPIIRAAIQVAVLEVIRDMLTVPDKEKK